MSTLRYSPGEYLAGSAIRGMLEACSDELVRRGWPAITVVSGTRLYAWQEAIFRARYVPASEVNGRKVYDFQWWNGVLWVRISSAGRVAPPSPTAPHVANIAADLGAPYNVYGAARNALLQVIRDLGLEGQLVNNGTSFGEVWHWESRRGAGDIGQGAAIITTPTVKEEEPDMSYAIIPDTDGGIYIQSLVTGQRYLIETPAHVDILLRAKKNVNNDRMLPGELDLVALYIRRVNPSLDRPVAIVSLPDGGVYVVDHGQGTKRNIAEGQASVADAFRYRDWLLAQGIPQYPGQASWTIAAYRDITNQGSLREEIDRGFREQFNKSA